MRGPELTYVFTSDEFKVTERTDGTTLYTGIKTKRPLHGLFLLHFLGDITNGDVVHGSVPLHSSQGRLVNGLQSGRWTTTSYDDGTYTATYRQGILHGPFVALDSVKRPLYRTTFRDGTGYFKRYYRNGRLAYEVLYYHNLPHGWALSYAADGRLLAETLYQKGHFVRRIEHGKAE